MCNDEHRLHFDLDSHSLFTACDSFIFIFRHLELQAEKTSVFLLSFASSAVPRERFVVDLSNGLSKALQVL